MVIALTSHMAPAHSTIIRAKGKSKRTVRRGGRPVAGQQSEIKKAYVTVKAGEAIPIFQSEDENAKPPKKDK